MGQRSISLRLPVIVLLDPRSIERRHHLTSVTFSEASFVRAKRDLTVRC